MPDIYAACVSYDLEAYECTEAARARRADADRLLREALDLEVRASFCRIMARAMRTQNVQHMQSRPRLVVSN